MWQQFTTFSLQKTSSDRLRETVGCRHRSNSRPSENGSIRQMSASLLVPTWEEVLFMNARVVYAQQNNMQSGSERKKHRSLWSTTFYPSQKHLFEELHAIGHRHFENFIWGNIIRPPFVSEQCIRVNNWAECRYSLEDRMFSQQSAEPSLKATLPYEVIHICRNPCQKRQDKIFAEPQAGVLTHCGSEMGFFFDCRWKWQPCLVDFYQISTLLEYKRHAVAPV